MSSQRAQASTSQHRPYQGYPYVNPMVIDVPSLDPATAARWTNLPRKQIGLDVKKEDRPVVYVDIPGSEEETSVEQETNETELRNDRLNGPGSPVQPKKEEDRPVIYIDLPESSGSSTTHRRDESPSTAEPSFVQETIFYDPFEDRKIIISREDSTRSDSNTESMALDREYSEGAGSSTSGPSASTSRPTPSQSNEGRPNLNLSSETPGLPALMSKETYVYGRQPTPDDDFPLPPIPVTEFPEPPPAYSEIDRVTTTRPPVVEQPRREPTPPRTQVIVPVPEPTHNTLPDTNRKYLHCHHCGFRVHTLVVTQAGVVTHTLALSFLVICLFPVTIAIYMTDCCKYRNHYCPHCARLIGYEVPILCQKMVYVK